MERLTGDALLAHVTQSVQAGLAKSDVMARAGYVDSMGRAQSAAFYEAYAVAKGGDEIEAMQTKRSERQRGMLKVSTRGGVFISGCYINQLGAHQGDTINIDYDQGGPDEPPALVITVAKFAKPEPAQPASPVEAPSLPRLPLQQPAPAV